MATSKILNQSYQLLQLLGKGTFGEVYLAKSVSNNDEQVAIKIIQKPKHELLLGEDIQKEIRNAQRVKNDNIIKIRQYFYDHDMCCLWIVMPLYQCSLRQLMKKKKFRNAQIRSFIIQMVSAFLELDSKNIMHLDVKPENIMVESIKEQVYHYVLIDLGCSQYSNKSTFHNYQNRTFGTLDYIAPQNYLQLNQQKFRSSADVWSLGVIIYEMIYQSLPYSSIKPAEKRKIKRIQGFYEKELKANLNYNKETLKEITELVYLMLNPVPSQRMTWQQIKKYLISRLQVEPYEVFDISLIFFCANTVFKLFLAFIKTINSQLKQSKGPIWKNNKQIIQNLLYSIIIYAQKLYTKVSVGQAYRQNLFGSAQKNTFMYLLKQILKLRNSFWPISNPYENDLLSNLKLFIKVAPCEQSSKSNNSYKFMRTFALELKSVLSSQKDLLSNVCEFKKSWKLKLD